MSVKRINGKRVFFFLLYKVKKFKVLILGLILTAFIGNGIALLGPWLTGEAIDLMRGENQVEWSTLVKLLLIMLVLFLSGAALQRLLSVFTTKLAAAVVSDLRQEMAAHMDRIPLKDLDQIESGYISSILTHDMNMISDGLVTGFSQAFGGIVTLTGTLILMFYIQPAITFILIIITPLSFVTASKIASAARRQYQEESKLNSQFRARVQEAVEQQQLLKAFNARNEYEEKIFAINQKLYIHGQKAQFFSSLSNPVTRLINASAYILIAVVSGIMAVQGKISVGNIASMLGYSMQFSKPVNEITAVAAQLQSAIASTDRLIDFLEIPEEQSYDTSENSLNKLNVNSGEIKFENVSFSYSKEKELIKNLNLSVEAGSQIAIVGPTGAGKTTLVNLLLRFFDVGTGDIKIDGQSIYSVSRKSLRSSFGIVLQDCWLFHDTIKNNIAFSNPEAGLQQIETAARLAGAHGFIERLPKGYNTIIGRDSNLSDGQKQLLAIARTMLADSPILVLDEATSNVDIYTEKKIQKAFKTLMHGRTSFIIAHRLSTILDADMIIVMKDGNVIEQGTHSSLLSADTFYSELFNAQFAGKETK